MTKSDATGGPSSLTGAGSDRSAAASAPFPDQDLVERLRRGDEAAVEEVLLDQGPKLLAVARRILKDEHEAHDVLQESFLMAQRGLAGFDGRSRLSTWLYRIVVNASLMRLRKRKRRSERQLGELLPEYLEDGHRKDPRDPWTQPDQRFEQAELRELLLEKIAELPDDARNIILLRDIQQLSTQEAADELGITPGNAKVRLHRARQALRELLDPLFSGGEA